MNRYCKHCGKYVRGVKKPFSLLCFIVFFGVFYIAYRILCCHKVYCPICGTRTALIRSSKHLKKA